MDFKCLGAFVTDWDETVTSKDSMELLSNAAYEFKPSFEPKWSYFVDSYLDNYRQYADTFGRRETLSQEIEFLNGLRSVEERSVNRVEKSLLFQNVPELFILNQASKVSIREGWWRVFKHAQSLKIPIFIISVNWSAALIKQVISYHGYSSNGVTIYANNIEMKDQIGTGNIIPGLMQTRLTIAQDKQQVVTMIKEQLDPQKKLIYFGDSSTDLLALIEADIGVVVHNDRVLQTLQTNGYDIHHVTAEVQPRLSPPKLIYFMKHWTHLDIDTS